MNKSGRPTAQKKTLRDYISIGFHRKWLFLVPCVLTTAMMIVGIYALPKKFRARALARRTDQAALAAAMSGLRTGSERTSLSVIREEIMVPKQLVNVLKRPEVLKVLNDPDLVTSLSREWDNMGAERELTALDDLQDSLAELRAKINIGVIAQSHGTEIIGISVTDRNPVRARVLANAIGVTYEEYHRKVLDDAATEAIKFPKARLAEVKADLKEVENAIEKFRIEKFSDLPQAKMAVLKRRADLDMEIPRVENNVIESKKQLVELRKRLKETPEKITHQLKPSESPEALGLERHILEVEAALTTKLLSVTENHPNVIQLRSELARARKRLLQIEQETDRSTQKIEVDNPLWQDLAAEERRLADDMRALQVELHALQNERDRSDKRIGDFSPEAHHYNEMLRNREALSKKYERYRTRVENTQLMAYAEKEKQGTTVKIFDPALLPSTPSFPPKPILVFALAVATGIGTGIGFVLLGELADHSFRTVEDASDYLDVPILGTLGTIEPAVSNVTVWMKRLLFGLMVIGLGAAATLSYLYQDDLRELFKSVFP